MIIPNSMPVVLAKESNSSYYPYFPPVEGEIAIIASTPYLGYDAHQLSYLEDIRDCGFNVINIFPS